MSQKILIKKSTVAGKVPVSGDLDIGELAVNTADPHLYTKHSDNSVKKLTSDVIGELDANGDIILKALGDM